jgi:hypothetical protein
VRLTVLQVDNGQYGLLDIDGSLVMPCRRIEWQGVQLRAPANVEGVLRHRWACLLPCIAALRTAGQQVLLPSRL